MKETIQSSYGRLPGSGELAGSWGCWSSRALLGGENSEYGRPGMYLVFQKSHFFLIAAGAFHPINLVFPLLSDFSLYSVKTHKVSPRGGFCPASPLLSGVRKTEFCKGLLGEFVIISYLSVCFPRCISGGNEGTKLGTTKSNFQGKSLWRTAPHSG